jgi:hypothetical protein
MYNKILNPITNRWINIDGKIGKSVLKMYLKQLGSGKSVNRFKKVADHIIEINRRYKQLSPKKQKDYIEELGDAKDLINNGGININNNVIRINNPEKIITEDNVTDSSIQNSILMVSGIAALSELDMVVDSLELDNLKNLGHSFVNQQQGSGFNTSDIYGGGITNLAGNAYSLVRKKAAEKLGDKTVSGMEEIARTGGNAVAGLANWILDHPGSSMIYAAVGIVIIANREHNRDAYNFYKERAL